MSQDIKDNKKEPPKRSCNRHYDCDEAEAKYKAKGGKYYIDHCHDDCCEECFGY